MASKEGVEDEVDDEEEEEGEENEDASGEGDGSALGGRGVTCIVKAALCVEQAGVSIRWRVVLLVRGV